MRKIRIVGVDPESSEVRCISDDTGEEFALPLDDRLRAAAKGEGPNRVEASSGSRIKLRPREIQERIRRGATPEAVAAEAGVPVSRIEGFSYPVILERANAADRARDAHPVLADGPSLGTLSEVLDIALRKRGADSDDVTWDAWVTPDGDWTVRTTWPSGHGEVHATWDYTTDSHGGSVVALDDEARDILDPERPTRLHSVRTDQPGGSDASPAPGIRSIPVPDDERTDVPGAAPRSGDADRHVPGAAAGPSVPIELDDDPGAAPVELPSAAGRTAGPADETGALPEGGTDSDDEQSEDDFLLHTPTERPQSRTSRRHPTMPSWEDVLLGVRSKDT